ncbi:MAG TPA: hypothetical protein VGP72_04250 [Planctomycetota bacterium]|jgi:hypothetical protein
MADVPLSEETKRRVALLFSGRDLQEATDLLVRECGTNLPFLEMLNAEQLERFRFAALKVSDGSLEKLMNALVMAQTDWRDLLMAAGFGHDLGAHLKWEPTPPRHD